jgi:hypothetical protein
VSLFKPAALSPICDRLRRDLAALRCPRGADPRRVAARLAKGGTFIAKVLAGGTDTQLLGLLKRHFTTVKHAKPPASRKDSSEWYVIAQGFKG